MSQVSIIFSYCPENIISETIPYSFYFLQLPVAFIFLCVSSSLFFKFAATCTQMSGNPWPSEVDSMLLEFVIVTFYSVLFAFSLGLMHLFNPFSITFVALRETRYLLYSVGVPMYSSPLDVHLLVLPFCISVATPCTL